ncbi:major facilitator superfamily domain-containing protein [Dactylonectria macrodidyma]|uniref:Major facilitator superfamily domain-containing protein n=1 Tax=Dactylonectria macrodidyma TaxID=307937 RepID=A0A9P9EQ14_9HYPO|nr:major facilitator superfamily domain-containing protein [Dactylonectria macrodidyma]
MARQPASKFQMPQIVTHDAVELERGGEGRGEKQRPEMRRGSQEDHTRQPEGRDESRDAVINLTATDSNVILPPPPDGGLQAWTQVAMGWIVIFTTWGYINSFGSFQTYYTEHLPQSPSAISWIGSVQTWLTFFIGAFSGRLLDAGFFVHTLLIGALLQLLGIFLMSISTSYWHLMLTQGVLTGLGGGIFFTPSLALVATYFDRRRGLAVGLATTGNSAGGMVYPIVVRQLLPKLGFAWTARTLGFLNLGCLALAVAFMRPRLPPRKSGAVIDWVAFKEPVYMAYVGGLFFFVWAVYYTFYYLGSFSREVLGLSYADASILITLINGAGLPARVLVPMAADKMGPINVISLAAIFVATVAWCWLSIQNVVGVYVFTTFYGLASGAFQCLMPTGVASITKRLDKVGTRLGMCFTIVSVAGLTGPPIGGLIQSATGDTFKAAQAWAASSSLLCATLLITTRILKVGWKVNVRC